MTTSNTTDTPAQNTWALLTRSEVTWRQATEGGAILTALSIFTLAATVLFRVARRITGPRT